MRYLPYLILFHILIIIASNYFVQFPLTIWGVHTTWGAFTFPFIFLATDLTVRLLGKSKARRVIAVVMLPALVASYIVSILFQDGQFGSWSEVASFNVFVFRIAIASFSAYVVGQVIDIQVFDRLRTKKQWWVAPSGAMIVGNLIDTFIFFSIAFWHSTDAFMAEHWVEIAWVDYATKLVISLILFVPMYGVLLHYIQRKMRQYQGLLRAHMKAE